MEIVGDKTGARPLDFMRAGFDRLTRTGLGNDGGILRFDRDRLKGLFPAFDHFRDAGDRSARADGGDEDIHLAIRIRPDFLRGGLAVDGRIGRILELLGDERTGRFLGEGFSPGDGAFHSFGGRGEFEFGSQQGQQGSPFQTHAFGHGQDELVTFGGRDEGEGDAGVAGSRLDDRGLGGDEPLLLASLNHRGPDPILHAAQRIEKFTLHGDRCRQAGGDALQFDQGGSADGSKDVFVNGHREEWAKEECGSISGFSRHWPTPTPAGH